VGSWGFLEWGPVVKRPMAESDARVFFDKGTGWLGSLSLAVWEIFTGSFPVSHSGSLSLGDCTGQIRFLPFGLAMVPS
jgi:hypothetical protein